MNVIFIWITFLVANDKNKYLKKLYEEYKRYYQFSPNVNIVSKSESFDSVSLKILNLKEDRILELPLVKIDTITGIDYYFKILSDLFTKSKNFKKDYSISLSYKTSGKDGIIHYQNLCTVEQESDDYLLITRGADIGQINTYADYILNKSIRLYNTILKDNREVELKDFIMECYKNNNNFFIKDERRFKDMMYKLLEIFRDFKLFSFVVRYKTKGYVRNFLKNIDFNNSEIKNFAEFVKVYNIKYDSMERYYETLHCSMMDILMDFQNLLKMFLDREYKPKVIRHISFRDKQYPNVYISRVLIFNTYEGHGVLLNEIEYFYNDLIGSLILKLF